MSSKPTIALLPLKATPGGLRALPSLQSSNPLMATDAEGRGQKTPAPSSAFSYSSSALEEPADSENEEVAEDEGKAARSEQSEEDEEGKDELKEGRPGVMGADLSMDSRPSDMSSARRVESIGKLSSSSADNAEEPAAGDPSFLLTSLSRVSVRKLDKVPQ